MRSPDESSTDASLASMVRHGRAGELVAWIERRGDALELDALAWLLNRGASDPLLEQLATLELDRRARALLEGRGGALDTGERDDALTAIAALLTRAGWLGGAPETQRLLPELHRRLWGWLPQPRSLPRWWEAALSPAIATRWLEVQLLCDPTWLNEHLEGAPREWLLQALARLELRRSPAPDALLASLTRHPDRALRTAGLRLIREGLAAALISPSRARDGLLALLEHVVVEPKVDGDDDDEVDEEVEGDELDELDELELSEAVLAALAEPWAQVFSYPRERLERLYRARPRIATGALRCAAAARIQGPLRRVMEDAEAVPSVRCAAMVMLGGFGGRGELVAALALAEARPLLLGRACLSLLRALHRRGIFVAPPQLSALLCVYLDNHELRARALAPLVYTCRHDLMDMMRELPADAEGWIRLAPLLVEMARAPAGRRPLGARALLGATLGACQRPRVARALLSALARTRFVAAEEQALAWLEREPAATLACLRAIGGERTRETLARLLGVAPRGDDEEKDQEQDEEAVLDEPPPWLRPQYGVALELLWNLSVEDDEARDALLRRLDPRALPSSIARDLGARANQAELALLRHAVTRVRASDYLVTLCGLGSAAAIDELRDLLLRLVTELDTRETLNQEERGEEQQTIPARVVTAIRGLGARLHERGRIRPVCLLDARDPDDAGRLLLSRLAVDLLERPDLGDGEQAILLRLLRSLRVVRDGEASPDLFGVCAPLTRHQNPHVRKLAIRTLRFGDAEALSINLIAATRADDIQTIRPALEALAEMGARWAAPAIAACLEHPVMNIKKSAAEALARAGSPKIVDRLCWWLGHHDNPGLRVALVHALRAILGEHFAATVLAAASAADSDRRRGLLISALSGALSVESVRAVVRERSPWAEALLRAVRAGEVTLEGGSRGALRREFAVYGMPLESPRSAGARVDTRRSQGGAQTSRDATSADEPAPLSTAVEQLRARWDDDAGARVLEACAEGDSAALADRALARDTREVLARHVPRWIDALIDGDADARSGRALTLLEWLRAALSTEQRAALQDQVARLLEFAARVEDEQAVARQRGQALALLLELLSNCSALARARIAAGVRTLPRAPSLHGPDPLELLRRCQAVITREDLEAAIARAERTADPAARIQRALRAAFGRAGAAGSVDAEERAALVAALQRQDAGAIAALRAGWRSGSRDTVQLLIGQMHRAGEGGGGRGALLDWLEALQPIDAAPWTRCEDARARRVERVRARAKAEASRSGQGRSLARRGQLLAQLGEADEERRARAAKTLLSWPELEGHDGVLDACLHGHVEADALPAAPLRAALARREPTVTDEGPALAGVALDPRARARLAALYRALAGRQAETLAHHLPAMIWLWERGDAAESKGVAEVIRSYPADLVLQHVGPRALAGEWGLLDLVRGPAVETAGLRRLRARARAEGRGDIVDGLTLRRAEIRPAQAQQEDERRLAELRARHPAAGSSRSPGSDHPPREELLAIARGHTSEPESLEERRRALSTLAERARRAGAPDRELALLLHELLTEPHARLRLHAHRLLKTCATRDEYLAATRSLLTDKLADVRRSAIRVVSFARYEPAIPELLALLDDRKHTVARAAIDGLLRYGEPARKAIERARRRARPDQRAGLERLLARLDAGEQP